MANVNEFYDAQTECSILLETLRTTANYANDLIGFISVKRVDDEDNILELQSYSKESLDNLQKIARQMSSYADRFNAKLNKLKSITDEF